MDCAGEVVLTEAATETRSDVAAAAAMADIAKSRRSRRTNVADKKRLQEQEARERREKLLESFMTDKACRESGYGRLNSIKLNWQWRTALRETKDAELRSEAEAMRSGFERTARTKDNVIAALADQVDADAVDDRTAAAHLRQLDALLALQNEHLAKMRSSYRERRSRTVETLDDAMDADRIEHRRRMLAVSASDAGLAADTVDWERSVLAAYESRRRQLLDKSVAKERALRAKLEAGVERLRRQMQNLMDDYRVNGADKRRNYDQLKSRDERMAREIDEQDGKIVKLRRDVDNLRRELTAASQSGEERRLAARKTKDAICVEFAKTTAEMERWRAENDRRLTTLTVKSGELIGRLETSIRKGKSILKMFELCSKYESKSDGPSDEKVVEEEEAMPTDLEEDRRDVVVQHLDVMSHFWRRYNLLGVQRDAEEARKRALMVDNAKLRRILGDYFDDAAAGAGHLATVRAGTFRQSKGRRRPSIDKPKVKIVLSSELVPITDDDDDDRVSTVRDDYGDRTGRAAVHYGPTLTVPLANDGLVAQQVIDYRNRG